MERVIDVSASSHYVGDCRELLARLPDACVQTCITSPPYYYLRDYGVTGQIGLEATPSEYIRVLVDVFRGVRRVLRNDGTLWLNLGDGYAGANRGGYAGGKSRLDGSTKGQDQSRIARRACRLPRGLKTKDLLGIPWAVAFALRSDGWYLRADIVWHKPNALPESVGDRPTKAHEYLFLLAKSPRYFYDADAIREPVTGNAHSRGRGLNPKAVLGAAGSRQNASWSAATADGGRRGYRSGNKARVVAQGELGRRPATDHLGYNVPWEETDGRRNCRSVWSVPSEPYQGEHFATFPSKLIEPCVLAGSRPGDLVLDPFFGSGTTGEVAEKHGRRWIGFDISEKYGELAKQRTAQRSLPLGAQP